MSLCLVDRQGEVVQRWDGLPATPAALFMSLGPYLSDVLIVCESVGRLWYWVADFCADEVIAFVLAHSPALRTVHRSRNKFDRLDADALARLGAAGCVKPAHVVPRERRTLRDLLRDRLRYVRMRADRMTFIRLWQTRSGDSGWIRDIRRIGEGPSYECTRA